MVARSLLMKSRKRLARDVVSVVTGAGLVYDVTDTDSGNISDIDSGNSSDTDSGNSSDADSGNSSDTDSGSKMAAFMIF